MSAPDASVKNEYICQSGRSQLSVTILTITKSHIYDSSGLIDREMSRRQYVLSRP